MNKSELNAALYEIEKIRRWAFIVHRDLDIGMGDTDVLAGVRKLIGHFRRGQLHDE